MTTMKRVYLQILAAAFVSVFCIEIKVMNAF